MLGWMLKNNKLEIKIAVVKNGIEHQKIGILKDDDENIIVFQNSHDPFATYEEVKKFMVKVDPKIKVVEKERTDHNYPYFEDFQLFLS